MAKIEAFELWVWQKMLQEVERRKNSMDLAQSWNASEGRIDCTVKEIQRKKLMEDWKLPLYYLKGVTGNDVQRCR